MSRFSFSSLRQRLLALVLRPVAALLAATTRLRAGDGGARTGLSRLRGELGELARALDEMAESVETQRRKAEESQRELRRERDLLRSQKELLQTILDNIPVMIAYIDSDGHLQWGNQAWEKTLGWTREEAQRVNLLEKFYPNPELHEQVMGFIQRADGRWADFKPTTREGKGIDTSWANVQLSDGSIIGIGMDVTERKRAEEEIYAQSAISQTLLRTAGKLNAQLELAAVLRVVGEEATAAFNRRIVAVHLYDEKAGVYHPAHVAGAPPGMWQSLPEVRGTDPGHWFKEEKALVLTDLSRPRLLPYQGIIAALAVRAVAVARLERESQEIGFLTVAAAAEEPDFSPRELELLAGLADQAAQAIANARLHEEVRAGRERLRAASRQSLEVQERERRHIARELHDEIGQSLTALSLTMDSVHDQAPDAIRPKLLEVRALVNDLLARVRGLSLDLRPAMLDDLGLLPALLWHLDCFGRRSRVQVDFKHSGAQGRRFDPEIETAAYRLVQEALTNVARHAGVDRAEVRLWADRETLGVQVADLGIGFNPEEVLESPGCAGLAGMKERMSLLGGCLTVESSPGAGVRVTGELPLGAGSGRQEDRDDRDHNSAGG